VKGRLTLLGVVSVLAAGLVVVAETAGNTVSGGRVGRATIAVTADALKPDSCSGVDLTDTIVGSGIVAGTAAAELILGSDGADTITAGGGGDCVLGGGGIDTITGGTGSDVCIGGAGLDVFVTCETEVQ
jgi:Ca2+-binding RTX toxin-like protein